MKGAFLDTTRIKTDANIKEWMKRLARISKGDMKAKSFQ
jgi:hypothetical protein